MATISPAKEFSLITQAQKGDRNAFGELIRVHAQGVQSVVYRMCGNQQLAEDAAQETFIQAWLKLPSYRPKSSLRNWLYRIAVNTAIDMLRKEKRIIPNTIDDLNLVDKRPTPERSLVSAERSEIVRDTIIALPDTSRAVLILREYEDLSYREIADTLDIPLGTVMSRLSYARKLLKDKLSLQLELHAEVTYA
ncbi:MAG: sigma-70 family RNA polymerase sigma factor [Anaerolineae bacterium]|nr:sigma-70 family RNA polymerase sigma factor [Anaerolineae bacterium]MBT7073217.1 sigma-70 family RNA polymerase sigma factor [Anaerolineae bacterium]MBT7326076.1 sigma-70 family RNA polymerase sigma factor [Anaerolineae bacterium]